MIFLVAQRNLCLKGFELECVEYNHDYIHYTQEFRLNLVGTTEYMSVILRKAAHTCQSVKFSALFVTVNRAEFCYAQRKIFV